MRIKPPGVGFFGKVRIPTIGHKYAVDEAKKIAASNGGELHIGLSGTSAPLSASEKRTHAEHLFGHPVMSESKHTSGVVPFLSHMSKKHDDFTLVAGSDRAEEYKNLIRRYNGKKDGNGNIPFNFKKWRVHSVSGDRHESNKDPRKMSRKELIQTVSASKVEHLAKTGNYPHFKAYYPDLQEQHVKSLYDKIRRGNQIRESLEHNHFGQMLDSFVDFASDKLGIKSLPSIETEALGDRSFGGYNPSKQSITVITKNRHPMDVFRTVAHELVHHKQNEDGRIKDVAREGSTGSPIEDEANSVAGILMRLWAQQNPEHFKLEGLTEGVAIFVVGGPCSGKDRIIKTIKEDTGLPELDIQTIAKQRELPITLIINGTADRLDEIVTTKKLLESNGYYTSMVFVDVSNEISKLRNEHRQAKGQKIITESLRFNKHTLAQTNLQIFREMFGPDITVVNNNLTEKRMEDNPANREWGTRSLTGIYQEATPGQKVKTRKKKDSINSVDDDFEKMISTDTITNPVGVMQTIGTYGQFSEWSQNPKTISRFKEKYGPLAEEKLQKVVEQLGHNKIRSAPKPFTKIRESFDKALLDRRGMVPDQGPGNNPDIGEDKPLPIRRKKKYNK